MPEHVNVLEFAIEAAESLITDSEEREVEDHEIGQDHEHIKRIINLYNMLL